jgi:ABC-type ATPase with predicted acetyltransferase domain
MDRLAIPVPVYRSRMDGNLYTCETCGRTYHSVVNPDCPRCAALGVDRE